MIHGSCCCGAVRFTLAEPPSLMGTCHCTRCRKLGASVFVFAKKAAFTLTQGADDIAVFEPIPPYTYRRSFCRKCGTALGEIGAESETFPIAANCFDDDLAVRNRFHEFVSEKPSWSVICDDAEQFEKHPKLGGAS
ncbi:MAG: GFA family protein [Hyphomonadaceae bacterium]|nr:GFA family protein [Hyphomonadaceae bacterium]